LVLKIILFISLELDFFLIEFFTGIVLKSTKKE